MAKYSVTYRESKDYEIIVEAGSRMEANEKAREIVEEQRGVLAGTDAL